MHLLSIDNVTAGYGHLTILHGVSLYVDEGEIVCLLGANGAGKSTLLRAVSRLIPVLSGSITYAGEDILPCKPHAVAKRGISHVPEGRGIFGNLTVLENLTLATFAGHSPASLLIQTVFDLFQVLGQRRRQLASTLSGGEQQMLAIGRAIVADGALFVLDEPSMGLSPIFVKNVFSIIGLINKKGKTILLVEQNASMALRYSHRAYVLENGRILASGTSAQIASDAQLTRAYLG